jgi:hypothetical protein
LGLTNSELKATQQTLQQKTQKKISFMRIHEADENPTEQSNAGPLESKELKEKPTEEESDEDEAFGDLDDDDDVSSLKSDGEEDEDDEPSAKKSKADLSAKKSEKSLGDLSSLEE